MIDDLGPIDGGDLAIVLFAIAVFCVGLACLAWIADGWGKHRAPFRAAADQFDQQALEGELEKKEFQSSKYAGLYLAFSRERGLVVTNEEEQRRLHEIHSQNCCTLYDQSTNSHI